MKPTPAQLKDPQWWEDNAPEGAEALVDGKFIKWIKGKEYGFNGFAWLKENLSWTLQKYKIHPRFTVVERPTKPAFVPKVGEWYEYADKDKQRKDGSVFFIGINQEGEAVYSNTRKHVLRLPSDTELRPEKPERELFLKAARKVTGADIYESVSTDLFNDLYDSGLFKLVEQDK